ncbi:ribonuclease T2 family protein [Microvirga pudoricolor]|uniref:ribonuclease T2 family protein n=1 Tax=Microvirga pudoricolor TaxID=2778729 RepID=UPI00194EFCF6|nr:ribonuclease T2 [Microvirga pudoricolor]MBM6592769.1 ribonuclease T2 [Microvirga pudoricolor]
MQAGPSLIPTRFLAGFFVWLLVLATAPAIAQDSETRGGPAGQFDFYVLALSWSPGFCALTSDADERSQCDAGKGLAFVTHGLWPQNERGYPVFCRPADRMSLRGTVAEAAGLFPDERLARYQWRKHGSCSGESPSGYFRAVQQARDKVRIPDSLARMPVATRAMPLEIERAFADANPGLRPDMMSVSCRRDTLQEVRICLTRDLRGFRPCPEIDRNSCRAGQIGIPATR